MTLIEEELEHPYTWFPYVYIPRVRNVDKPHPKFPFMGRAICTVTGL